MFEVGKQVERSLPRAKRAKSAKAPPGNALVRSFYLVLCALCASRPCFYWRTSNLERLFLTSNLELRTVFLNLNLNLNLYSTSNLEPRTVFLNLNLDLNLSSPPLPPARVARFSRLPVEKRNEILEAKSEKRPGIAQRYDLVAQIAAEKFEEARFGPEAVR